MTPTIKGIKLKNLRKGEYSQLMKNLATIVAHNDPSILLVQAEYDELVTMSEAIDFFFRKKRGSGLTPEVAAADHRRDKAVVGIHGVVKSYLHHFEPENNAAAQLLVDNMEHFDTGIAQKNYMAETAIIRSLVTKWQTRPDLLAAADLLHLTPWVAELEAANQEFNDKFIGRIKSISAAPQGNMQQQRLLTNESYYKLRNRLLALGNVNDYADPWGSTIRRWNTLVEDYSKLLNRHSSKEQITVDEDTATAPPEPLNDTATNE